MTLSRITDHVARRLARLAMLYRNSASHKGVISALAKQIQDLEDAAFELLVVRSIDDATAAQLDEIAKILKVEREARDDAGLRLRLRAQVLVNSRSGEIDTLLRVLRLLSPAGAAVRLEELFPASVIMRSSGGVLSDPVSISNALRTAKAAGVNLQLVCQTTADDGSMFTLTDTTQVGSGLGLGDTSNATTGGQLAAVY